jgi:hypothetical protein
MSLCCFRCQGRGLAIDIANVLGVRSVERLLPVPLSPPALVGLTLQQRQLIPVVTPPSPAARERVADGPRTVLLIRASQGILGLVLDAESPVTIEPREARSREGGPSGSIASDGMRDVLDPDAFWAAIRSEMEGSFRSLIREDAVMEPVGQDRSREAGGRDDAP